MIADDLRSFRRDLHRKPEPAWREFYTTARIVAELEARDVDDVFVGPAAIAGEHRLAVPDDDDLETWYERARETDVDDDVLERLEGGYTGAVAVLECGDGPTVGLRVDVDGLPITESDDPDHDPAAEGFRSEHEGAMHACGHDAHAAIGIGVLEAVRESDFSGTLKLFFQPAEEVVGGGKAMAKSGHLDDVDYLLAVHVGLDHPTGEVVAGVDGFLAVRHYEVTFTGESAHAGARPEEGRSAIQALATAVQNLYAIPRHAEGATRVNVGVVEGGTAANIVAEAVRLVAEVRGETTELVEYMDEQARRTLRSAAMAHGCEVDLETVAEAPSAESDTALAGIVEGVAAETAGVETVLERDDLGGSEDATFLMREVQRNGGLACYVGVGTDHPGGHHTPTFDVDEETIDHGVDVLAGTIEQIGRDRP
ncbi:amidohydrolase [Natrialbaceae archaeon AArc-T1-2]|uniref:amidohydrolase n=1 Tax=Natrialbaceae archaeon AArc-T1-2 TaxID=3053904 RepID=UPI00255AD4E4|nr:amidohydrolase [Natrialbaceae archaeon AArc-T1-2]WIV66143.1 amidohydrolase [Natrialbaceae archaeon AArc-T1-2]